MTQQTIKQDVTTLTAPRQKEIERSQRCDGPHAIVSYLLGINEDDVKDDDQNSATFKSKIAWWCDPRKWVRAILQLRDTPHAIALGTAVGVFIGLTPTFGIQMLLVLALSFLVQPFIHFNRFAALVAVYISNPFTMIPIYWFNYRVGAIFMRAEISWAEFVQLFQYSSYTEWWPTITNVFHTLGTPLIVGSLLVATFFSLPTYPLMLRLAESVHAHREARHHHDSDSASKSEGSDSVAESELTKVS